MKKIKKVKVGDKFYCFYGMHIEVVEIQGSWWLGNKKVCYQNQKNDGSVKFPIDSLRYSTFIHWLNEYGWKRWEG